MIVNYRASVKTRAPFCGLRCCGNHFGIFWRGHRCTHCRVTRKVLMRRYAKHADKRLVKKEIEMELNEDDYSEADYEEAYGILDDGYEKWSTQYDEIEEDYDEKYDPDWCEYNDSLEEDFVDEPDRVLEALEDEADIIEGEMMDEYYRGLERYE